MAYLLTLYRFFTTENQKHSPSTPKQPTMKYVNLTFLLAFAIMPFTVHTAPTDSIVKKKDFDDILIGIRNLELVCTELDTKPIPTKCRDDAENLKSHLLQTSSEMVDLMIKGNKFARSLKRDVGLLTAVA